VAMLELFGTARCPHTQEMREWLEWKRAEFVEYDVEADVAARRRMSGIAPGQRSVPLLVENGKVVQVGWRGQSCMVEADMVEAEISELSRPKRSLDGARTDSL
jgi:glutaredoxin